jgi:hypothetical protein
MSSLVSSGLTENTDSNILSYVQMLPLHYIPALSTCNVQHCAFVFPNKKLKGNTLDEVVKIAESIPFALVSDSPQGICGINGVVVICYEMSHFKDPL